MATSSDSSWLSSALAKSGLVPENYVKLGADAAKARETKIKHLLTHVSGFFVLIPCPVSLMMTIMFL
jgi:hypothetical protein